MPHLACCGLNLWRWREPVLSGCGHLKYPRVIWQGNALLWVCADQICNVSYWISPILEERFSASTFLVSHFRLATPAWLVFFDEGLIFSKSNLNIKLHVAIKTLLGGAQIKRGSVHSITGMTFCCSAWRAKGEWWMKSVRWSQGEWCRERLFFFFFPLLILWRMGFGWSEEELYPPWCSGLSPLGYSVCGVDRFVCDAINHFAVWQNRAHLRKTQLIACFRQSGWKYRTEHTTHTRTHARTHAHTHTHTNQLTACFGNVGESISFTPLFPYSLILFF